MKNLDPLNNPDDLIAGTIQEAGELSPEHQVPAHETISLIVDSPSIELDTEDLTAYPPLKLLPNQNRTPFRSSRKTHRRFPQMFRETEAGFHSRYLRSRLMANQRSRLVPKDIRKQRRFAETSSCEPNSAR